MDLSWKDLLRSQLGAAIDMLENAVLAYLEHGRKARTILGALTEERARQRCGFDWLDDAFSFAELMLVARANNP